MRNADIVIAAVARLALSKRPRLWFTTQAMVALAIFLGVFSVSIVLFRVKAYVLTLLAVIACAGATMAFTPTVDAFSVQSDASAAEWKTITKKPFGEVVIRV